VTLEAISFAGHECVRLNDGPDAVIMSTSVVFVSDAFCELETLGPLRELAPGDMATNRERWIVRPAGDDR
jgi:hypothetical protein